MIVVTSLTFLAEFHILGDSDNIYVEIRIDYDKRRIKKDL